MVEHDKGTKDFEEAVQCARKSGLSVLLYTTHRIDPTNPDGGRFPFYGRMIPKGHEKMVNRAHALFGAGVLAPESWALSQPYHYGRVEGEGHEHFRIEVVDGGLDGFIDISKEMPEIPKPKTERSKSKLAKLPKKWQEIIRTGDAFDYGNDRSDAVAAVAKVLVNAEWLNLEIETVLTDPSNVIAAHILAQDDRIEL